MGAAFAVTIEPLHVTILGGVVARVQQVEDGHPLVGLGVYGALGLTIATDVALVLLLGLVATVVRTAKVRSRHRAVLDLVGARSMRAPGAVLLDDSRAAAYYLPGLRPRIVLSKGTLSLLDNDGLSAVLAHERGHAQEHHGLVMLPFASMDALLHWMPYARHARGAVSEFLEMAADDFAGKHIDRHSLAAALIEMSTSGVAPACTFAASSTATVARVHRLLGLVRGSKLVATAAVGAGVLLVATPLAVMLSS